MKHLVLTLCLILIGFVNVFGQEPGTKPTPTPPPTLELTQQEKEFLKLLGQKITPIQQGLQDSWNRLLTTEDEKEAVTLWLKARLLNIKSMDIQKEFTEWFEKIKIIHKCPECNLQGDKLVKPEPVPSKTPPTKP